MGNDTSRNVARRRRAGRVIFAIFALTMVFGTGPGLLFVNSPDPVQILGLRLPTLYAWALLCFAIQVACVIAAAGLVWTEDEEDAA